MFKPNLINKFFLIYTRGQNDTGVKLFIMFSIQNIQGKAIRRSLFTREGEGSGYLGNHNILSPKWGHHKIPHHL